MFLYYIIIVSLLCRVEIMLLNNLQMKEQIDIH